MVKTLHEEIQERIDIGMETYGKPLTAKTPVNLVRYAFEEVEDLAIYYRAYLIKQYGIGDADTNAAEYVKGEIDKGGAVIPKGSPTPIRAFGDLMVYSTILVVLKHLYLKVSKQ